MLQALWNRIVYPSAFYRAYRCVVRYIKSDVMEELANLIFIGCYIAQCSSPGFKTLWMRLQPALWHYMYGRNDTTAQRNEAEASLKKYAKQRPDCTWLRLICKACKIERCRRLCFLVRHCGKTAAVAESG